MAYFTLEELQSFSKDQLLRVCQYLELPVNKSTKQSKMIQTIMSYMQSQDSVEEGVGSGAVQKSVRIRRIEESNK